MRVMLNPVVALSVESQLENEEEGGSAGNANQGSTLSLLLGRKPCLGWRATCHCLQFKNTLRNC